VRRILVEISDEEDESRIQPETKVLDVRGVDSLERVEFVMELEEYFGVIIPDSKAADFSTVADVVAYLDEQCWAPAG
jgi:acyl carrier protein